MFNCGCSLKELRGEVQKNDATAKEKELQEKGTGSYGYGGKFGVQKDRMDKVRQFILYFKNSLLCVVGS